MGGFQPPALLATVLLLAASPSLSAEDPRSPSDIYGPLEALGDRVTVHPDNKTAQVPTPIESVGDVRKDHYPRIQHPDGSVTRANVESQPYAFLEESGKRRKGSVSCTLFYPTNGCQPRGCEIEDGECTAGACLGPLAPGKRNNVYRHLRSRGILFLRQVLRRRDWNISWLQHDRFLRGDPPGSAQFRAENLPFARRVWAFVDRYSGPGQQAEVHRNRQDVRPLLHLPGRHPESAPGFEDTAPPYGWRNREMGARRPAEATAASSSIRRWWHPGCRMGRSPVSGRGRDSLLRLGQHAIPTATYRWRNRLAICHPPFRSNVLTGQLRRPSRLHPGPIPSMGLPGGTYIGRSEPICPSRATQDPGRRI